MPFFLFCDTLLVGSAMLMWLARDPLSVVPFYDGLIAYITSSPVVVIAAEGPGAVAVVRATVGVTRPAEATAGSIRADFGLMVGRNLIHASDGLESAERELSLWFDPADLVSYERAIDRWVLE